MDPQQLKLLADAEFNRALHRKNIRENAQAQLTMPYAGGLFLVSPTLIAYLSSETSETVYLEDAHGNPVLANRAGMLSAARDTYNQAMKAWYDEQQLSNRIRKVENV